MNAASTDLCPLCHGSESYEFHRDARREYRRCQQCALVSVPARFHVSPGEERAEYDLHENAPDDLGYRNFLNRLAAPLVARLPAEASGLDFGSGPGPTLSLILQEAGHEVALFDPFYANDPTVLEASYDFIMATEVVEHLRDPKLELQRLLTILNPGGVLAIMTKLVVDRGAFASWHYKNDKTHIAFFSQQTFEWWAGQWHLRMERVDRDVIFLSKAAAFGTSGGMPPTP